MADETEDNKTEDQDSNKKPSPKASLNIDVDDGGDNEIDKMNELDDDDFEPEISDEERQELIHQDYSKITDFSELPMESNKTTIILEENESIWRNEDPFLVVYIAYCVDNEAVMSAALNKNSIKFHKKYSILSFNIQLVLTNLLRKVTKEYGFSMFLERNSRKNLIFAYIPSYHLQTMMPVIKNEEYILNLVQLPQFMEAKSSYEPEKRMVEGQQQNCVHFLSLIRARIYPPTLQKIIKKRAEEKEKLRLIKQREEERKQREEERRLKNSKSGSLISFGKLDDVKEMETSKNNTSFDALSLKDKNRDANSDRYDGRNIYSRMPHTSAVDPSMIARKSFFNRANMNQGDVYDVSVQESRGTMSVNVPSDELDNGLQGRKRRLPLHEASDKMEMDHNADGHPANRRRLNASVEQDTTVVTGNVHSSLEGRDMMSQLNSAAATELGSRGQAELSQMEIDAEREAQRGQQRHRRPTHHGDQNRTGARNPGDPNGGGDDDDDPNKKGNGNNGNNGNGGGKRNPGDKGDKNDKNDGNKRGKVELIDGGTKVAVPTKDFFSLFSTWQNHNNRQNESQLDFQYAKQAAALTVKKDLQFTVKFSGEGKPDKVALATAKWAQAADEWVAERPHLQKDQSTIITIVTDSFTGEAKKRWSKESFSRYNTFEIFKTHFMFKHFPVNGVRKHYYQALLNFRISAPPTWATLVKFYLDAKKDFDYSTKFASPNELMNYKLTEQDHVHNLVRSLKPKHRHMWNRINYWLLQSQDNTIISLGELHVLFTRFDKDDLRLYNYSHNPYDPDSPSKGNTATDYAVTGNPVGKGVNMMQKGQGGWNNNRNGNKNGNSKYDKKIKGNFTHLSAADQQKYLTCDTQELVVDKWCKKCGQGGHASFLCQFLKRNRYTAWKFTTKRWNQNNGNNKKNRDYKDNGNHKQQSFKTGRGGGKKNRKNYDNSYKHKDKGDKRLINLVKKAVKAETKKQQKQAQKQQNKQNNGNNNNSNSNNSNANNNQNTNPNSGNTGVHVVQQQQQNAQDQNGGQIDINSALNTWNNGS